MSIKNRTFFPQNASRWGHLKCGFSGWRHVLQSRNELMSFDERTLRDIGLSREAGTSDESKLFWLV